MLDYKEHPPPVIPRLNALMARGFKVDEQNSQEAQDALWLKHPADKRFTFHELFLYDDGLVVSNSELSSIEQFRCETEESGKFTQFLETIPFPTWTESHYKVITDLKVIGCFGFISWLLYSLFYYIYHLVEII